MTTESEVEEIVEKSFLGRLRREQRARLMAGATRRLVPGGVPIHRDGSPFVALVLSGLTRGTAVSSSGREVRLSYRRTGDLGSLETIFAPTLGSTATAVVDTELLVFDASLWAAAARSDAEVGYAIASAVASRSVGFVRDLLADRFATVPRRVALRLLDLSAPGPVTGQLTVRISQPQLAIEAGTVREVVARILGEFRSEGIVRTARGVITILRPVALEAIGRQT